MIYQITENLPEYWRLDVSSSYRFFFSDQVKGNFSIALLNVLGKENTLNTYYELTNNQTEVRKVNNISLGFSPNASFLPNILITYVPELLFQAN